MQFINKKLFILIGLASIFLVGWFFIPNNRSSAKDLWTYAEEVLNKCSSETYKPSCFDREIPKLMDSISFEDAFQVTRYIQEQKPEYLYCHILGHNLAERETKKDPSKWKDVVAKCPTTMCNNGCPHGALMERFKTNINDYLSDEQVESIKPDLMDVCEPRGSWNPREVERSMCYHALGHLHMYITNGDLRKSAGLCREIGPKTDGRNYVQTCTEGVFMSVYQPLGPEDIALIKDIAPTKETMSKFCAPFKDDEMSYHACHKEAWAIFRDDIFKPEGYIKFCSYTNDWRWQDSCFRSVMNPITDEKIVNDSDIEWLKTFCGTLPEKVGKICIYASVQRLIQIDPKLAPKALEICQSFVSVGTVLQGSCYYGLSDYSTMGFRKGSPEFIQYCGSLPEPWKINCLNR